MHRGRRTSTRKRNLYNLLPQTRQHGFQQELLTIAPICGPGQKIKRPRRQQSRLGIHQLRTSAASGAIFGSLLMGAACFSVAEKDVLLGVATYTSRTRRMTTATHRRCRRRAGDAKRRRRAIAGRPRRFRDQVRESPSRAGNHPKLGSSMSSPPGAFHGASVVRIGSKSGFPRRIRLCLTGLTP